MASHKNILVLLWMFLVKFSMAQEPLLPGQKITHYSISGRPIVGFVFAHDVQVSNTAGTTLTGAEVKLNRKRQDKEAKRYVSSGFNSGFSVTFMQFSKNFLGHGIFASYFVEPYFINNDKITLGLIAKLGLSYNSNPYHEISNNQNFSYSSAINPFLSVGFNSTLKVTEKFSLDAGINFNHNSNGGIKHPNYGMNFPTAALGLLWNLHTRTSDSIAHPRQFKWRFDVTPFGSYKSIASDKSHFYWVYGLVLQANRKTGWYHSFNLGAEWISDLGKKKEFEMTSQNNADHNRFGVLAGHEFLFRKFNFGQQIGFLLNHRNAGMGFVYHRWGLNYSLHSDWMIGFNLSAHKLTADFLDVRLVYSKYK